MRIPINLKITIIILVSLFLQSAILFWLESSSIKNETVEETIRDYRTRVTSLQQTLSFLAQKNESIQLQQTISALGSDTKIKAAHLLNEHNQIIASTQISSIKKNIFNLLDSDNGNALSKHEANIRENLKISLWKTNDLKTLYAASPIILGKLSNESLRLDRIGVMLLQIDLDWINSSTRQTLLSQSPRVLAILFGFTLMLMLYFHFVISRRIKIIHHTTANFSLGQALVARELSGNDELSDLQNTFNRIAKQANTQHQELLNNERRLNKTQEIAQLGSWELDLINNRLTWTDEVYRMFGLSPQQFPATYEAFLDAVHPDDRELVNNAYSNSIREGKDEYEVEHRIIPKDTNETRYVYEKCIHYRDDSGNIVRSVGMVHDITERKLSENAKQQSDLLFRSVIDASPVPYALNDEQQNITYLNPAFTQTFGYELADIPTLSDWWPKAYPDKQYREDIAKTWQQHLENSKATNTPFKPMEIEIYCKDGSKRTVLASATSLNNNFMGQHLVILYDITERKNIEKSLQFQKEEQQQILNNMVDAVISIDQHGIIQTFNTSAETTFGTTAEEAIGKNIKFLMPNDYAENHDTYLAKYIETNEAHIIGYGREVTGLRKNGSTFPMRLSVAELPKTSDGTRRFIGTCHDLTQEKLREDLLRHSQKMEALGKLTGGIAHDFNNMLGVILGYAELLKSQLAENTKQSQYINEINQAGTRAKKLTSRLLAFSRKKPADTQVINLNQLILEDQHMLEKTLTARIKLNIDLAPDLWPVQLDKAGLQDAVLNISINAMHAMPDGGDFTISTSNLTLTDSDPYYVDLKKGDYILLSLTDTGMGMDNETKLKVFDPFFTTKKDGSGLGLSQVYGFVQQCNGSIHIYSEPGHGTRITIYFPRYNIADKIETNIVSSDDKLDLTGSGNILVVDDEPALVELAKEILSSHGYNVITATSGEEALKILQQNNIDVLMTDIIMPGMDGYQLTEKVQQLYPEIKIQLASGFSDKRNSHLISDELYKKRLQKPFSTKNLLVRIKELLSKPTIKN